MTSLHKDGEIESPETVSQAPEGSPSGQSKFTYGGQAVMEGVMIRGQRHVSLAIRRQDGTIDLHHEPLSRLYTGPVRRFPLARGVVVLLETLVLGIRALQRSANMALRDAESPDVQEISNWALAATLAVSLTLGVGLFFLLPVLIVWAMDPAIPSAVASNTIEGAIRLAILLGYIWAIGLLPDVRRVFAYHGAEHMVVHAYEAGLPLIVSNVRKFGTPHPRCGTAFLLTVVLVSVAVFVFLGRPAIEWRILSRIVLIPVIAGVSYEIIRFSGSHQRAWAGQLISRPGLLLQRLTTRAPDDDQIEVAICAMETAVAADQGTEYAVAFGARPAHVGGPQPSPAAADREGQPVPGPETTPAP